MKPKLLFLFLCLLPAVSTLPQTANDPNEGSRLSYDPGGGAATLAWWARAGIIYHIQYSFDLGNWADFPGEVLGADAPAELFVPFGSNTRVFLRLQKLADTDRDGLTDADELNIYHTDPFKADTNGDGINDAEQVGERRANDPRPDDPSNNLANDPDSDGDGIPNTEDESPRNAAPVRVYMYAVAQGVENQDDDPDRTLVRVRWDAPARSDVTSVTLQRADGSSAPWTDAATLSPSVTLQSVVCPYSCLTYRFRLILALTSGKKTTSEIATYEIPLVRSLAIRRTESWVIFPGTTVGPEERVEPLEKYTHYHYTQSDVTRGYRYTFTRDITYDCPNWSMRGTDTFTSADPNRPPTTDTYSERVASLLQPKLTQTRNQTTGGYNVIPDAWDYYDPDYLYKGHREEFGAPTPLNVPGVPQWLPSTTVTYTNGNYSDTDTVSDLFTTQQLINVALSNLPATPHAFGSLCTKDFNYWGSALNLSIPTSWNDTEEVHVNYPESFDESGYPLRASGTVSFLYLYEADTVATAGSGIYKVFVNAPAPNPDRAPVVVIRRRGPTEDTTTLWQPTSSDTVSPIYAFTQFGTGTPLAETIVEASELSVDIEEVISDQISGNEANKLPTPYYRIQPNNPMLMATRSGNDARLVIKMEVPAAYASSIRVGVRVRGETAILNSAASVPSPAKTLLSFMAADGSKLYEVVAGYDANGNGALDSSEVTAVFQKTPKTNEDGSPYSPLPGTAGDPTFHYLDGIVVVTQNDYTAARATTEGYGNGFTVSVFAPTAAKLINAFGSGANTITGANPTEFGILLDASVIPSADGLAHPLGAKWNSINQANTHRIVLPSNSPLARQIVASQGVLQMYDRVLQTNIATLAATATSTWSVKTLPVDDREIDFAISDKKTELHFALGKCRVIGSLEVSYRALPAGGIEVNSLNCYGNTIDLYDFAYGAKKIFLGRFEIADPKNAARTQAGNASLASAPWPDAGRVFFTKVEFGTGWFAYHGTYQ